MLTPVDDLTTAWFEVGRGTPVVLIHGLGDDHRAWRLALPDLAARHRVLLYDLRGHGQTTLGQARGDLAQLGADLVGWLDALEVPQATLAGFSLGGTIAMRVAIDHPQRVAGLALVATSSRVGRSAAGWYAERAALVANGAPGLRATLDADTAAVYANAPAAVADGLRIRRESTADPAGYANACRAMAGLHAAPLDPELARISAPTVILAADRDQHCPPRAGEIIAAGIPGATLAVVPACGHPIPVERPD
ncbi:MAG TPA: alpha/beta fold hydrolase, partial [Candidatus Dormibacteraeota bacterium]|nr:alpha/beta fold hydrolase [Candidatus Dormibacteraeota bacterium]